MCEQASCGPRVHGARTLGPGVLALACLLGAPPAMAQVYYAISGSTAYVTSSPNASGDIVIASTFNAYPVTAIEDRAFEGRINLSSVTIPNSVTNIGSSAFRGCTRLTRLTIPSSVTVLGDAAFLLCTNLTNFTFLGNAPSLV